MFETVLALAKSARYVIGFVVVGLAWAVAGSIASGPDRSIQADYRLLQQLAQQSSLPPGSDGFHSWHVWSQANNRDNLRMARVADAPAPAQAVTSGQASGSSGDRFQLAQVTAPVSGLAIQKGLQLNQNNSVFTGTVQSSSRRVIAGATVHLVPTSAIDMTPITARAVYDPPYKADAFDEPLEDAIRLRGKAFPQAVTDDRGQFVIRGIADGKYFVHVTPAAEDRRHLPGGDRSRHSYTAAELRNASMTISLSSKPSDAATYTGSTVCLTCHKRHSGWKQTGHKLAWSVPGKPGKHQDFSRFPDWFKAMDAWKKVASHEDGTHLELGDYKPKARGTVKFKVRLAGDARMPIDKVYASVYLWQDEAKKRYYISMVNRLNGKDKVAHLPIELVYGGGVHRQRFVVSVPEHLGKRPGLYTVLQFNNDGRDSRFNLVRRIWRDYKFSYWWSKGKDGTYGTGDDKIKAPSVNKNSLQSMCAGCHVTGVSRYLDKESGQIMVRGVDDPNGAFNIDDDPSPDEVNVGCESCHGPGSEHVENAQLTDQFEMALVNPKLLSSERANVVCGRCHDRRKGHGKSHIAYFQPMSKSGEIMKPGGSRHDMITVYSSTRGPKPGSHIWPDDVHSSRPHQQYADFIKSGMYRNDRQLVTCADCHNMHGGTPFERSLIHDPKDQGSPLCQRCHEVEILSHMDKKLNSKMKGIATKCTDCHMPATMVTGGDAGHYGQFVNSPPFKDAKQEAANAYWGGHIESHVFSVPRKTNVGVWGVKPGKAMPIPYTSFCGTCHKVNGLAYK